MRPNPRKTLAENLKRIIGPESNPTRWSADHRLDKKPVQRLLSGRHATTIDTIETISKAAGLQPWQMLIPNLDPSNPPVFVMTQTERDLYARLRAAFDDLPRNGT